MEEQRDTPTISAEPQSKVETAIAYFDGLSLDDKMGILQSLAATAQTPVLACVCSWAADYITELETELADARELLMAFE